MKTSQIPWKRVFAEGLVIVFSILAAFAIDRTWENRQAQEDAADLRRAIRAEMEANRAAIAQYIDGHDGSGLATSAILESTCGVGSAQR